MKNTIKIVVFLTLQGIFRLTSSAQEIPNIVPPSPNAQTFLKYGEFPVSNYTGVPDITIPIYTIQMKDLSVPITLSYNASGIRVGEEAGQAGLGWVLNAGGLISHTIMGRYNDFEDDVYFNSPSSYNNLSDLTGIYPYPKGIKKYIVEGYYVELPFNCYTMTKEVFWNGLSGDNTMCGGVELVPDLFNYSFLGYSGKFIFSHSGNILREKEDNLIFELTHSQAPFQNHFVESWKITDSDGTKYYFNQKEQCVRSDLRKHTSSFYLTSIETVNGTTVNFSYSKRQTGVGLYNKLESYVEDGYSQKNLISYAEYDIVVLDSITYPGGKVRFNYAFDRLDCSKEPRLATIYIHAGNEQFKWNFEYDYFTSNVTGFERPTRTELTTAIPNSANYYTDSWNTKRLKLNAVRKTDKNDALPETYQFSYNETALPTKLSTAIDHWGYYNGHGATHLIPSFTQNISQQAGTIMISGDGLGANREASFPENQAFLLNKITYPTGGKTVFTYEANKYKTNHFENDPYKRDFMYSHRSALLKTIVWEHNAGSDWNKTEPFPLPAITDPNVENKYPVTIDFKIWIDKNIYNTMSNYTNRVLYLSILDGNNQPCWSYTYDVYQIPSTLTANYFAQKGWNIELSPGTYTLKASGNLITCIDSLRFYSSTIKYPAEYIAANPVGIGGGLRIKEIRSFDASGTEQFGKRYTYTFDGNNSESQTSGKLMFYPRYRRSWKSLTSNGLRGSGYSVGYSSVHVSDIDTNGNTLGKTVSEYINIPDKNLFYTWEDLAVADANRIRAKDENPSGIGAFKHSENGTLLRETCYKKEGSVLPKVKSSEWMYNITADDGPHMVWGVLKSDFITYHNEICRQNFNSDENVIKPFLNHKAFGYLYPALRPIWIKLEQRRDTVFEVGQAIVTTVDYDYNPKHYLSREISRSLNIPLKTVEYTYPSDVEGNALMTALTNANRISTPVEIKQTINNQVKQSITDYAIFNTIPYVSELKCNTGNNKTLETRILYHNYDSHGNPLYITKDNADRVVCLWGYKHQYPIAEIKNATYDQVKAILGQAFIDQVASSDTLSVANLTTINHLRSQLPNAMVSTYTYKPLTGIQTATDPRGITTYYEYDIFGRLEFIKDRHGNIIEKNDYHHGH